MQRTHGFGVRPAAWSARNGATTPAANASRRSSVRCGRPIRWATARASRTAWAEQHDASASLAGSRHSSSVTQTASRPARAASSAATAESTPPLMATSVRPGAAGSARAGRGGGAERLMQRVGGQLGGVELAGREAAELVGDLARADPRRGEQRRALRQRDGGGRRGDRRAAAGGLESGGRHALAVQREVDPDQVAARRAAGRAGERLRGYVTAPVRVVQVLGEALGVHGPSVGAGC